ANPARMASDNTQVGDFSLVGDGFIGTVVAVGRDIHGRAFAVGDYVRGSAPGGKWIETFEGGNTGVSDDVLLCPSTSIS
ncbi:hypothetical protein FRB98_007074, partial [Tulasnella sp. 332]